MRQQESWQRTFRTLSSGVLQERACRFCELMFWHAGQRCGIAAVYMLCSVGVQCLCLQSIGCRDLQLFLASSSGWGCMSGVVSLSTCCLSCQPPVG